MNVLFGLIIALDQLTGGMFKDQSGRMRKLPDEENHRLQRECGRIDISDGEYNRNYDVNLARRFPWAAKFYHYDPKKHIIKQCTATIISPLHVLVPSDCTAAKSFIVAGTPCVNTESLASVAKVPKEFLKSIHDEVPCNVSSTARLVSVRGKYRLNANFTIVRLSERLHYNENLRPICIPNILDSPEGAQGSVFGFGHTEYSKEIDNKLSTKLKWADVVEVLNYTKECERNTHTLCKERQYMPVQETFFCSGDNGGGFEQVVAGIHTLFGILIHNTDSSCSSRKSKAVTVAMIQPYSRWICLLSGVCPEPRIYMETTEKTWDRSLTSSKLDNKDSSADDDTDTENYFDDQNDLYQWWKGNFSIKSYAPLNLLNIFLLIISVHNLIMFIYYMYE